MSLQVHVGAAANPLKLRRGYRGRRQRLTLTEYQVAFLAWQIGLPDQTIAKVLGIPTAGTVRTHRCRARAKIRAHLEDEILFLDESDMTGGGLGEEATA
jgi:DNA-binding CsgD family transcriptional regulator